MLYEETNIRLKYLKRINQKYIFYQIQEEFKNRLSIRVSNKQNFFQKMWKFSIAFCKLNCKISTKKFAKMQKFPKNFANMRKYFAVVF